MKSKKRFSNGISKLKTKFFASLSKKLEVSVYSLLWELILHKYRDIKKKKQSNRLFCDKIPRYHVRNITPTSEKSSNLNFLYFFAYFDLIAYQKIIV